MYLYKLVSDLEQYIEEELTNSVYYKKLAEKAPNNYVKGILQDFSNDEKGHAENFKQAYYYLTGKAYTPNNAISSPEISSYDNALRMMMLSETTDYKKYGEHYLSAPSKYFKDLFFGIKSVEAQHAMRIPVLFEGEEE
jgi:rubrerythrin